MTESYLAILDYKAGNQTSVHRALAHLKIPSKVTSVPQELSKAAGVIFPGVGAAGQAMEFILQTGLDKTIKEIISGGTPFFGICLGCQIMLEYSEENDTRTLGIFPGKNIRFDPQIKDEEGIPIRVPHMGWNTVTPKRDNPLWEGIGERDQFYFVHSYHPVPSPELVLGTSFHGREFASIFGRDGVWAVQFHPEKSGPPGLRLLSNFHRYSTLKKDGQA